MYGNYENRWVYLIQQGDRWKIGSSLNPEGRMAEVCPEGGAVLIHEFPSKNAFRVENALQRRFAASRINGLGREWFHLSDEDVAAIRAVGRADSPGDLPADLQVPPLVPTPALLSDEAYRQAKVIASHRNIPLCRYLGSLVADQIERDYRAMADEILAAHETP